jgi:hypothetical protein
MRIAVVSVVAMMVGLTAAQAGPFDGAWSTTLNCPKAADGALGYSFKFVSHIKDGALHGQYGTSGQPASLTIDGKVADDGSVSINADGITGDPNHAVKHVQSGSPYHYTASGRFDGRRGTAHRAAPRVCDYSFVKQ